MKCPALSRWPVCSAPPGLFPALFVPIGRPCLVVGLAAFVMDDDGWFADGMIGGDCVDVSVLVLASWIDIGVVIWSLTSGFGGDDNLVGGAGAGAVFACEG